MNTRFSWGRRLTISLGLLSIFALLLTVVALLPKQQASAARKNRFSIQAGDLVSIGGSLGSKRFTRDQNVKILFEDKRDKVLYGKGWSDQGESTERVGGTELWIYDKNTDQNVKVTATANANYALTHADGRVFFTTTEQDLMVGSGDDSPPRKVQEKTLTPDLSPDGKKLVYQKLPKGWKPGEYFDGALGLTIFDLTTSQELRLTNSAEDWNPLFSPDGKKILFSSANQQGVSSFFSINIDGTNKTQLTNFGVSSGTAVTVPSPSEKPKFSPDGSTMIFESDRGIWRVDFDKDFAHMKKSKQIGYGVEPQWNPDGKSISIITAPESKETPGVMNVDLEGNLLK